MDDPRSRYTYFGRTIESTHDDGSTRMRVVLETPDTFPYIVVNGRYFSVICLTIRDIDTLLEDLTTIRERMLPAAG